MFDILYNGFINYCIFNTTFYLINIGLFIIDYKGYFSSDKIQKNDKIMIVYKKCITNVLFNSLIGIIPAVLLSGYYESISSSSSSSLSSLSSSVFSYKTAIIDMLIARILMEILFYTCHRLFHLPIFYKLFHKKHHEIKNPIGIAALYMSLIDLYIGNIFPLYFPLIIIGNTHHN